MTVVSLIGHTGLLGTELEKHLQTDALYYLPVNREQLNINRDPRLILKDIDHCAELYNSNVIVIAAAMTRPMNKHDQDPASSIRSNIMFPALLAEQLLTTFERKIDQLPKLVYISTDYVYPGTIGNYTEDSPVKPINKYAWSKLGGECVMHIYPKSLILRTAHSTVEGFHRECFNDSYKSCISPADAAKKMIPLILDENILGVYNIGGPQSTIYDYYKKIDDTVIAKSRLTVSGAPANVSISSYKYDNLIQKIQSGN